MVSQGNATGSEPANVIDIMFHTPHAAGAKLMGTDRCTLLGTQKVDKLLFLEK